MNAWSDAGTRHKKWHTDIVVIGSALASAQAPLPQMEALTH
jgi:hypothetical protein